MNEAQQSSGDNPSNAGLFAPELLVAFG